MKLSPKPRKGAKLLRREAVVIHRDRVQGVHGGRRRNRCRRRRCCCDGCSNVDTRRGFGRRCRGRGGSEFGLLVLEGGLLVLATTDTESAGIGVGTDVASGNRRSGLL